MNTDNVRPAPRQADGPQLNAERAGRIAQEVTSTAKVPGMSVAVASPEGILYAGAVGYADLAARRKSTVVEQYP